MIEVDEIVQLEWRCTHVRGEGSRLTRLRRLDGLLKRDICVEVPRNAELLVEVEVILEVHARCGIERKIVFRLRRGWLRVLEELQWVQLIVGRLKLQRLDALRHRLVRHVLHGDKASIARIGRRRGKREGRLARLEDVSPLRAADLGIIVEIAIAQAGGWVHLLFFVCNVPPSSHGRAICDERLLDLLVVFLEVLHQPGVLVDGDAVEAFQYVVRQGKCARLGWQRFSWPHTVLNTHVVHFLDALHDHGLLLLKHLDVALRIDLILGLLAFAEDTDGVVGLASSTRVLAVALGPVSDVPQCKGISTYLGLLQAAAIAGLAHTLANCTVINDGHVVRRQRIQLLVRDRMRHP